MSIRSLFYLTIIFLFFIGCWYYPRNISIPISGKVIDAVSGNPIDSVKIKTYIYYLNQYKLYESDKLEHKPLNPVDSAITYTDENGKYLIPEKDNWTFVIMNAGPRPYSNYLIFTKSGYEIFEVEIMDYYKNKLNLDKIKVVKLFHKNK